MTVQRTQRLMLDQSGLILTSTRFEQPADFIWADVAGNHTELDSTQYKRRHVVFQGSFAASFPGTAEAEEIGHTGHVFPSKSSYAIHDSQFMITARDTDSIYYCVIPQDELRSLSQTEYQLLAGDQLTLDQGSVYFIWGSDYVLNNKQCDQNQVIACEQAAAQFQALSPVRILKFSLV